MLEERAQKGGGEREKNEEKNRIFFKADTHLDKHWVNTRDLGVHVLLQVFIEELKDKVELVLGVHNLVKPASAE